MQALIRIFFLFCLTFTFILFHSSLYALKIQQSIFGNIKVFVTDNRSEADLMVFMTKIRALEKGREDVWCLVDDFPDLKITITNIKSAANLIVFFTTFRTQAGWINPKNPLKGKLYSLASS